MSVSEYSEQQFMDDIQSDVDFATAMSSTMYSYNNKTARLRIVLVVGFIALVCILIGVMYLFV